MPTLNKPTAGDTDWATEINDNWTALESQLKNAFQGRLQRDSTTQISLQRYGGDIVEVNGANVSIGSSGLTLAPSTHRIDNLGDEVASGMATNTLYYIYISNSSASYAPSSLRASTTAPQSYNGVKYLGTTGNAANWRFVGYAKTNGTGTNGEFVDTETQRFVINYYNKRHRSLRVTEVTNTWTYGGGWRSWNNSTANRVEFIANGEDLVFAIFTASCAQGNNNPDVSIGLGLDSTSSPAAESTYGGSQTGQQSARPTMTAVYSGTPSQDYHYLQALETADASVTWVGDNNQTFRLPGIEGFVMG